MNTITRILVISFGISVLSLIVAVFAVLRVTSLEQSGGRVPLISVPEPKALTADNPASKLQHAEGMRPVSGIVKSVSGSEIILTTKNGEQALSIGSETKFYRQGKQKDAASYQKEMQAFQDTLKNAVGVTEIFIAPPSYEMSGASVSDFKSGRQVSALVGGDGTTVQVTVLSSSGPNR